MKQPKILVIPNAEITKLNGCYYVEKNTGEFVSELSDLGANCTFFGQYVEEINNIHVFQLKQEVFRVTGLVRSSNKILNYLALHFRVLPEIFRADFVYIFYPSSFKYIALICKLFGRKYGFYVRGSEDMNGKIPELLYKNAHSIFTVADYFSININNIVGKKIANTIRPMIDLTQNDIVRERKYEKKNSYNILYLGRMTNDKGIIELLQATAELKKNGHLFHLDLVGDGEYFQELQSLALQLDITKEITFHGATFNAEAIKQHFLTADLFILPTYHEGFPRTLYESMIYGTPIITTFVGGISSVMINNINCVEIQPKSVTSITKALEWCFENHNQVALLAQNATQTVDAILRDRKYSHAEDVHQVLNKLKKF